MAAKKTVQLLIEKGFHISFAESCTGGLCMARLVEVPDASRVLDAGVVTYADAAKVKYLNVLPKTIGQFGVVSEEVAGQMAKGVAQANGAQVGVGVTGIAGPSGGTERKPVGMVCFGFYVDGALTTYTMQFGEIGRNAVREASVEFVYRTLEGLLGGGE
ncbi:MAG: CinA family protein [Lachnospiraceae bacterium]|nr:CinA family protein [Lachnospiraceae bacterium]